MLGKVAAALVIATLLMVAAAALLFWRRPLAVLAWSGRRALEKSGLHWTKWPAPAGPQMGFKGGSGPLVVLLHGAGDQAGTWAKVAPGLARRFTVIALDLAGHGGSEPKLGPISPRVLVESLDAVLARENSHGGPAILVGNSLGAWIAFLQAHRKPGTVAHVVAVDGGPLRGVETGISLFPRNRVEAGKTLSALRDPGSPLVPGFVLDDVVRHARNGPLPRLAQAAGEMEGFLLEGRLGEVKTPVTLLWGESDRLMPLSYARRVAEALPNARLTTLPHCGHVPQVECPEAFAAALDHALENPPVGPWTAGPPAP